MLSNQNFANIISILSSINLTNIKTILVERNHIKEFTYGNSFFSLFKKKIIFILMYFLYRFADFLVTNSYESSLDLSRHVNKKVITKYNFRFDSKQIY